MSLPISWCEECYATSFPECEDLTFPVGLDSGESYKAIITNAKNQQYSIDVVADSGGAITVPYADFPQGFFNPYQGFYTLDVTQNEIAQTLTIAYSAYDCVSFDIYSLTEL